MRPGNRVGGQVPTRADVLDLIIMSVNRIRLIFKLFYFFFFSAYGSLFPLLALYFKQLGMNPTQCGILLGFRPFVEFLSAPLWGGLADKWRRGRFLLLCSLFCWIVFTMSIAFVKPESEGCVVWNNATSHLQQHHSLEKQFQEGDVKHLDPEGFKAQDKSVQTGTSPLSLEKGEKVQVNVDTRGEQDLKNLITPRHTNVVYHQDRVNEAFVVILVLIIVGEFFCAPAISLADAAVLSHLSNEEVHGSTNYGRQRMFGSIGWGLSMFLVGVALDQSKAYESHPCGQMAKHEKNYVISFAVFTVMMSFALVTATQFNFPHDDEHHAMSSADPDVSCLGSVKTKIFGDNSGDTVPLQSGDEHVLTNDEIIEKQLQIKLEPREPDAVSDTLEPYADVNAAPYQYSKWVDALRLFTTPHLFAFLLVALFMGMGMGLVFTFLYWHLQDLGGQPTLFGIASAMNHGSEILAYFYSSRLIASIGYVKVLYMGLLANAFRFIYVALLRSPWWVLPIECIQGLTHATVWAACISYITKAIPREFRASSQGLLQGIHHGLGRGIGAVLGGVVTSAYGSQAVFLAYGIASLVVLLAYFALHYFTRDYSEIGAGFHSGYSASGSAPPIVTTHLSPQDTKYGADDDWEQVQEPGANQRDLKDALEQLH